MARLPCLRSFGPERVVLGVYAAISNLPRADTRRRYNGRRVRAPAVSESDPLLRPVALLLIALTVARAAGLGPR